MDHRPKRGPDNGIQPAKRIVIIKMVTNEKRQVLEPAANHY